MSSPKIPPGGEGKIEVKLRTAGRKGKLNKSIVVKSDDPKQPNFILKLKGEVEIFLETIPNRLDFGRIAKKAELKRVVKISGKLAVKAKLKIGKISSNKISAKIIKDESQQDAVEVLIKGGDKAERISANLELETGLTEQPKLKLFIWGVVSEDIYVQRAFLHFPPFKKGHAPKLRLPIASLSKKPFRVIKIVDQNKNVEGRLVREKNCKNGKTASNMPCNPFFLEFELKKEPKQHFGMIDVVLNRKDQKRIQIRYSVRKHFNMRRRRGRHSMMPPRVKALKLRKKVRE